MVEFDTTVDNWLQVRVDLVAWWFTRWECVNGIQWSWVLILLWLFFYSNSKKPFRSEPDEVMLHLTSEYNDEQHQILRIALLIEVSWIAILSHLKINILWLYNLWFEFLKILNSIKKFWNMQYLNRRKLCALLRCYIFVMPKYIAFNSQLFLWRTFPYISSE